MGFSLDYTFWIYQTVAMLITCALLPRLDVEGPIPAFLTVLALAFVNSQIWNAALFFEIPNTLSYRTVVLLLSNGVIFWVVVKLLPGISISGVVPAILAPIIFTVTSILIGNYAPRVDWPKVYKGAIEFVRDVKEEVEKPEGEKTEVQSSQGSFANFGQGK